MAVRVNKGRQRSEICEIKDDTKRHVTFSKRRSGLFKKASELCSLIGAKIAVIVKSPGGKTFSFGYPSLQSVIDRYENVNSLIANESNIEQLMEFACKLKVENLMTDLAAINEELEKEKMKSRLFNQDVTTRQAQEWTEKFVDIRNDKEQLKFYENVLKELSGKVAQHFEMLRQDQVEQLEQNVVAGLLRHLETSCSRAQPLLGRFMGGESSSHNAVNRHDSLLLSPPHAKPLDLNPETRQSL